MPPNVITSEVYQFMVACGHGGDLPEPALGNGQFNQLATKLFAVQFEQNPSYRALCQSRKQSPASVSHWTQIPTVPTVAFKEFEFTCLPSAERTTLFCSSGTTSQRPSRHFHAAASLEFYYASLGPWFQRHLLPGDSFQVMILSLTPGAGVAPHSSLAHMLQVVTARWGKPGSWAAGRLDASGGWTLVGAEVVAWLRQQVSANEPVLIAGTAFNFVHLLDFLGSENLRLTLPAGSVVMETGGYKGRSRELPKAQLHALITGRLGVPPERIVCEYGMCELSSQAYDLIAGDASSARQFRFPPWARARVVSPETVDEAAEGETGLLQVFDLANAFSVLAIQSEDLAIRRGDAFELIGRAEAAEPRGCSLMTP